MRKIIGIGETILDIVFQNNQPTAAVPGGSAFNAIISLGRAGTPTAFVSETGDDKVGDLIIHFMEQNGVDSHYMNVYPKSKSAVSLAFLDERNDAQYVFYKDHPNDHLSDKLPLVEKDDIILFGSYYAINPVIRDHFFQFVKSAHEKGAILYYDVNFRPTHVNDLIHVTGNILENLEVSDIVRGSAEDFGYMFKQTDPDKVYQNNVSFYCRQFICTDADKAVRLITPQIRKSYEVKPLQTVSTIGAGDNFNAGVLFGLLRYGVKKEDIPQLDEAVWDKVIAMGMQWSADVCCSLHNYISPELADEMKHLPEVE